MTDRPSASFDLLIAEIIGRNEDHIANEGPAEQHARALNALTAFHQHTPLTPAYGSVIDLAGFGEVGVRFTSDTSRYVLLSEAATTLGMPVWTACKWADGDHLDAIREQRTVDEERGDGRLGYDCLRGLVDLHLCFIVDNPEAEPDAGGRRWSEYGEWLLADDRLPLLTLLSPWGREFMDNTWDHYSIGMRKIFGDKLDDLTAVDSDGNPVPGASLFQSDLSEEEALRKARRGPSLGDGDEPRSS